MALSTQAGAPLVYSVIANKTINQDITVAPDSEILAGSIEIPPKALDINTNIEILFSNRGSSGTPAEGALRIGNNQDANFQQNTLIYSLRGSALAVEFNVFCKDEITLIKIGDTSRSSMGRVVSDILSIPIDLTIPVYVNASALNNGGAEDTQTIIGLTAIINK